MGNRISKSAAVLGKAMQHTNGNHTGKIGGPRQLGRGQAIQLESKDGKVSIHQGDQSVEIGSVNELKQDLKQLREVLGDAHRRETAEWLNHNHFYGLTRNLKGCRGFRPRTKDEYFEANPLLKLKQKERYKESLVRFIDLFRKGEANKYGIQNIVNGLLGRPINDIVGHQWPIMIGAEETALTKQDKGKIVAEVLQQTGFSEGELDACYELSKQRASAEPEKQGGLNHLLK